MSISRVAVLAVHAQDVLVRPTILLLSTQRFDFWGIELVARPAKTMLARTPQWRRERSQGEVGTAELLADEIRPTVQQPVEPLEHRDATCPVGFGIVPCD